MNTPPDVAEPHNLGRERSPRRHILVTLLAGVLAVEFLAIAGAVAFLVFELLVEAPDSYASAIALTVVAAIAAVWVAAIIVGVLGGRAWVRGATVVVQIIFVAIAIGSFQGLIPRPDIGWMLLLPAIAAFALLFSKPVVAWTSDRE